MTPERLDPSFADLPEHFRTLPVVLSAAEAFLKVARSAGIAVDGSLSREVLEAVGAASAAQAGAERYLAPVLGDARARRALDRLAALSGASQGTIELIRSHLS